MALFRSSFTLRSNGITIVENGGITFNAADNEVSYILPASRATETLYWSLPDLFTGDQVG